LIKIIVYFIQFSRKLFLLQKLKIFYYFINISLIRILGSFAKVRLARHKTSNKIFAVKMLKKAEVLRLKQADHVVSELTILRTLNHPFIVEIKGYLNTNPKYLYFVLEYVAGGELFTLLRNSVNFPEDQCKFYAAQIVTIFEYLHCKHIIYRDLKPENVLIQTNGYIKLTDFGFSKVIEGKTYTLCGTPEYLAPEIIMNKGNFFFNFSVMENLLIGGLLEF